MAAKPQGFMTLVPGALLPLGPLLPKRYEQLDFYDRGGLKMHVHPGWIYDYHRGYFSFALKSNENICVGPRLSACCA